jgi:hypothetical protein
MAGSSDYDEKELKGFTNVVRFLRKPFVPSEMLKAIRQHALPKPNKKRAARSAP